VLAAWSLARGAAFGLSRLFALGVVARVGHAGRSLLDVARKRAARSRPCGPGRPPDPAREARERLHCGQRTRGSMTLRPPALSLRTFVKVAGLSRRIAHER
jgi:hypothetical protein